MTVEFLLTTLIVVATPGTGVIYTLAAGLSRGTRASFVAAVGCTLGIVPHVIAAITGLAAVMNASAAAFETLKVLGVAYLLYLAWATLSERGTLTLKEESAPTSARRVILTGVLINVLNPKLTIFFLAFLPQFVDPGRPDVVVRMLELSAVFMVVTLVVFAVYGAIAASARERVLARPAVMVWLRRAFAASFAVLGVRLALAGRS